MDPRDTDRGGRAASTGGRLARARVSQDVADFIARRIFDGTLASRDRIDLDAIADELGVSRIPVREALTALEREGLVSTELYRGFRVSPLDAAVVHESFELYGLLASLAVRQVTETAEEAEIDRLASVGAATLVTPVSNAEFSRLCYGYRRELHKAGGSPRLRHLLAGFRASLSVAGEVIDATGIVIVQKALQAEIRALQMRDPDLAARAAFETLRCNGQVVVSALVARGVISAERSTWAPSDIFARAVGSFAASQPPPSVGERAGG
ncbi:MAG TPA: GntR family transcriptional regulator [Streptosporangiaceae bacterium]|nr:GntR family transcriptional regulator [Streptosporangiaceae bacterium]